MFSFRHTKAHIIHSPQSLKDFIAFAFNDKGETNPDLVGAKVLLIEAGMMKQTPSLRRDFRTLLWILAMYRRLDLKVEIISNVEEKYLEPRIRLYIDKRVKETA